MPAPEIPENEEERLRAVEMYEAISAPAHSSFKKITELIRDTMGAFDTGISIVKKDTVRYYSCILEKDPSVPRELAFSSFAILQEEPLVVWDLSKDERFVDNPFVESAIKKNGFTMADGVSRPYQYLALPRCRYRWW